MIGGNLQLVVAAHEVDKSSLVQTFIPLPRLNIQIVLPMSRLLEEDYFISGSSYQNFVVHKEHLAQRAIEILILILVNFVNIDCYCLPLSIKTIHFVSESIVEAAIREIDICAI